MISVVARYLGIRGNSRGITTGAYQEMHSAMTAVDCHVRCRVLHLDWLQSHYDNETANSILIGCSTFPAWSPVGNAILREGSMSACSVVP